MHIFTSPQLHIKPVFIYLLTALCVTQFLFFIDEGFYDFRWMGTLSNWFFFVIYTALFFCGQLIAQLIFWKKPAGHSKYAFICSTGILIGFAFALVIFTGWKID